MSQTVITTAFEQLKAQQAASGAAVVLDGFIFANVPNLDITSPIDPAEAIPPAAQIVHRADVTLTGVVNENAVVYSVTLGTAVGDFDFNWVGLINKASNTLAMIVHAPVQNKVANASGVQGNVLTRSFLMEYSGAKKETQITTPAATWQIDFTARLGGIDERIRLENVDTYGAGAFIADGFLVKRSGSNYSITAGVGYVSGLRAVLAADQTLTVTTKPVKVWVDTCFTGTLTSIWRIEASVTVANTLIDYIKNDIQHYVFAVAQINADGTVTDLRKIGSNADDKLAKHIANPDAHSQYAIKKDVQSALNDKQPLDNTLTNLSGKDIVQLIEYLGLTDFADKGSSNEQRFNALVSSKKGVSAVSIDGKRRVNLFVSETGYELIVYIDGKYNNSIQIPTRYGTMALLDDISNSVQSAPPPIGIPFFWPLSALPNTVVPEWASNVFLKMNDATFSASTYPALARVWPGLKLTDCRGEFLRIWDDGRGVDPGRALLSAQGDAIRNITGSIGFASDGLFTFVNGAFKAGPVSNVNRLISQAGSGSYSYARLDASEVVPTATENRPRNVVFNLLVRAK